MRLNDSSLMQFAAMICGDEPFNYFPYRSSSKLTTFFTLLDLEYIHDGSTRKTWVYEVLKTLNYEAQDSNMPSLELKKVIENLVHPEFFMFKDGTNHEKAVENVNKVLNINNLILVAEHNSTYRLAPKIGEFISTSHKKVPTERFVTFAPSIFELPNKKVNDNLVSVMMPFSSSFTNTYAAIKKATDHLNLECKRADDIWDNETILQDIFDLIYCAKVVIVDFSSRNPNVMYETGIAHTLGKTVIPITQSFSDIPSDIGNHRALLYYPNSEGYRDLSNGLYKRLKKVFNEELSTQQ